MRVTFQYQGMRYNNSLKTSLNEAMVALDKMNKQRKLSSPETSPSNYLAAFNIQRIINDSAQYKANAENASGWLNEAESAITQAISLLRNVRDDWALAGANGTQSLDSMKALAGDVKEAYNTLLSLANTQYMGRYIFAGFQTTTQPFISNSSTISSVTQSYGKGGQLITKDSYADLSELASGKYTVQVDVKGDTGYLSLYDSKGNKVILDSNGTDETASTGNSVATELSFKLEAGKIINTGRGISVKLPDDISGGLKYEFTYKAGSSASYYGDDGLIKNLIGATQSVITNFTGSELFMQSSRILKSLQYNSVNGTALTASSVFSEIDRSNAGLGDSISIQGTDHNGYSVGAAKVLATDEATLNMLRASDEERTLTIGYGGKYYRITVPQEGYASMDELVSAVNHELKQAQYAGAQTVSAHFNDAADKAAAQNMDIQNGLNVTQGAAYQVDLSSRITAVSDGGRLRFVTSDTGDQTSLSITGDKHNTLGFNDKTVLAMGKDTVFELGYDFAQKGINTIFTENKNVDLSGTGAVTFIINGEPVIIENFASATTKEAKELLIDRALQKAGFGFNISAQLADTAAPGVYDITFTMQNVNFDRNTYLATTTTKATGETDYQMATLPKNIVPYTKEKTISDYMDFITELYDHAVNVSLVDGRIVVEDLRSGESRLTMNVLENNEGIGLPIVDQDVIISGRYTGAQDDQWNVNLTMNHNPATGSKDIDITIYDKNGKKIYERTVNDYKGGEITLPGGIKLAVDTMNTDALTPQASTTFNLDLRANPSLNFGDMNVSQEGANANAFESLMNLFNALNNGIGLNNDSGLGAPSVWDKTATSCANPYFDGTFTGNSNATWTYQVEPLNGKSEFYLQDMFSQTSGKINYINDPAITTVDFGVQIFDNTTGAYSTRNFSVSLAGVTDSAGVQRAIADAVNNDPALSAQNVRAVMEDGKVTFESGSGTKNITVIPKDEKDVYMMGVETQTGSSLQTDFAVPSTFSFNYMSPGGVWSTTNVTLSGVYADVNAVLADINTQLGGAGTATVVDGVLRFTSAAPFYYDNVSSPNNALGLTNNTQNYISGTGKTVSLDMANATDAERTLTFKYNDGVSEKNISIKLDAKLYASNDELLQHINSQLTSAGLGGAFTAVQYGGGIGFQPAGNITFSSIEGDHGGYLGFPKTGDLVNIKVTDEYGKNIQNIFADTAHKEMSVADGVLLGFDSGSLSATNRFTGTVGSGVEFELGVLDMVQSQLLQALTQVGNRSGRVESVINFHATMKESYENQKAVYLGSTQLDIVELTTNYTLATDAYKNAMSVTTRIISWSIFDYI